MAYARQAIIKIQKAVAAGAGNAPVIGPLLILALDGKLNASARRSFPPILGLTVRDGSAPSAGARNQWEESRSLFTDGGCPGWLECVAWSGRLEH